MLEDAVHRQQAHVDSIFDQICASFVAATNTADKLAHEGGLWPRMSPTTMLQHLSGLENIPSEWKSTFFQYGIALSQLQYYRRLVAIPGSGSTLLKELLNCGHIGWEVEDYPEWLLFEIENNLLIRPAQAQIAKEMLAPSTGKNSIMQLNMGEGKSSIIVPIVAATLAKRQLLPRVIVLPALATQMFHILRHKLGGLLNCKVVSLPFSRSFRLSPAEADTIGTIYKDCLSDKCVVLCQPEHLLSFDLLGIEKSIANMQTTGKGMFSNRVFLSLAPQWVHQSGSDPACINHDPSFRIITFKLDIGIDKFLAT
jgi:hypothetical protein